MCFLRLFAAIRFMALSREDLRSQLKRHEIAPVYMLFGPESHLRDVAAKTIADFSFAEGDLRDFNYTSFSLNTEGNLTRALAAAQQLPMMATRRVIRVTDVRVSATGFRDTIREEHEPLLSAYLSNPSPTSVLIFISDELNGVRKMGKFLREMTRSVEFKALSNDEMAKWATTEIAKAGATIDGASLRMLISLIGPDVRRLTNEIKKLATAALPGTEITAELIGSLVARSREQNHFELTKHLVAGRRREALTTLKKILDDEVEPLQLLGLIAFNYRNLLIAKGLMERGVERREVASAVRLRYDDQEPFLAAARRATTDMLDRAIMRLAKTDLAIKTSMGGGGPVGSRMQIEMLVCELATI